MYQDQLNRDCYVRVLSFIEGKIAELESVIAQADIIDISKFCAFSNPFAIHFCLNFSSFNN